MTYNSHKRYRSNARVSYEAARGSWIRPRIWLRLDVWIFDHQITPPKGKRASITLGALACTVVLIMVSKFTVYLAQTRGSPRRPGGEAAAGVRASN